MSTGLSRGNSQNKQFIENVASKYNIIAFVDVSANYPNDGTLAAVADGQQYAIDSGFSSINANWGVITNGQDKAIIQYVALKSQWEVVFTPSASEQGTLLYDKSSDTINSFNGTDWSVASGSGGSLSTYYSETVESLNGSEFSCFDGGVPGAGAAITTFVGIDTTNPLNGKKSLTFTIPATGAGKYALLNAAKQIAVPLYAQSKRQLLTFESRFDGNTGDISLFLWDVTNSATIKDSTGATLYINPSNGVNSNKLWFETSATANLQWGVIINTPNTGKILTLDNLQIDGSPNKEISVYASSEWKPFSGSFNNVNLGTGGYAKFYERRVGENQEIMAYFQLGTGGSITGTLLLDLPNSINSSIMDRHDSNYARLDGRAEMYDYGNTGPHTGFSVLQEYATNSVFFIKEGVDPVNDTQPFTSGELDEFFTKFSYPVVGWSDKEDNVVVSGTKATYAYVEAASNAGEDVTVNATDIPFIATDDTKGLWNGSQFTADRDMVISITGGVRANGNTLGAISIYVNGIDKKVAGFNSGGNSGTVLFSAIIEVNTGDIVSVRLHSGSTSTLAAGNTTTHNLQIKELPNYEDLILAYLDESTIALSIGLSDTYTVQNTGWSQVKMNIIEIDTESSYNPTTGNYTIRSSGIYNYAVSLSATASSSNDDFEVGIYVNGSLRKAGISNPSNSYESAVSSGILSLNAGDILSIHGYAHGSGSSITLVNSTTYTNFSIYRLV